jgi:hypothetical protein
MIGILITVPAIISSCMLSPNEVITAEHNAREWAKRIFQGKELKEVNCINRDSDGDYYVSCAANVEDQIIALECLYTNIGGCKIAQPKLKSQ